jgi:hypothetical protein
MQMEEVREMGAPSSYLTRLLHNPNFAPGYNWVKPLSPRVLWSNPVSSSFDGHRASSSVASPRRKLPDAATCRPFLHGTSTRVLRPKPINTPPMVLRSKPKNLFACSVLHTHPLLMVLRTKPPNPPCRRVSDLRQAWRLCLPSWLDPPASAKCHDAIVFHLDSIDVVFITHVHLRLLMSQMLAIAASHPASWSLSPSLMSVLHRSWSIGMARPPWPSPRRRPSPPSSTPAQHKSRDMLLLQNTLIIWPTCAHHCLTDPDWCTRKPHNSGSLSGVLGEPQIIHILQLIQDQQWSYHNITTLIKK